MLIETTRQGVYFVYKHVVGNRVYKKVYPSNTRTAESFISFCTELLHFFSKFWINIGWNFRIVTIGSPTSFFAATHIFIIVIKKLTFIQRLLYISQHWLIITHYRQGHFNQILYSFFHKHLFIIM